MNDSEFERAEALRSTHEELEQLLEALAQRQARSPWIFSEGSGPSQRITALQMIEASKLWRRYKDVFGTLDAPRPPLSSDLAAQYALNEGKKGLEKYKCAYTQSLNIDDVFSYNEYYGRLLDLQPLYELYRQRNRDQSYESFLEGFPQPHDLEYLQKVLEYLESAFTRFKPFEEPPQAVQSENTDPLWCNACNKQYTTEGVFRGHLNGRKHKRNASRPNPLAQIQAYCSAMGEFLQNTKVDVRRRKQMTERELQAERENIRLAKEREDTDAPSKQHPNVAPSMPVGPDGKPIPRWLWKLNGMNHEFECEICGGFTYMGRRQFDRHFDAARHTSGLKCLGIENSSLYHGITSIEEARQLSRRKAAKHDIEVEDSEGNVYEERTFNDLKRQGLL